MIGFLKKLWRDRRGNALVIAGAALPLVVGSAGLMSDTIQWVLWQRQLQRVADSAATAGVYAIVAGKDVGSCGNIATPTYSDPVAYDISKNSDITSDSNVACTVTNPPAAGSYAADEDAVKVSLTMHRRLSFSSMFMTAEPTISASATATIVPSGHYCVVSLENTSATGITATGNATVDLGCGMITNSTSLTAAVATGSSNVTASPIAAVGGIDASDNWGTGTVLQPFTVAQEDPFADVDPPTPSGCKKFSQWDTANNNKPNGTVDLTTKMTAGGTYCLKESSGTLTIQGNVTFPSGVYVLDSTSLKMTDSKASLTCHDCVFIMTTSGTDMTKIGTVSLQGGKLDLSSWTGDTYTGLMFYQDRRSVTCTSANCQNLINGNSSSILAGAAYFPRQQLTFNGTAGMTTDCLQLVARNVSYSGNMNISNQCDDYPGAHDFTGKKVRLVA